MTLEKTHIYIAMFFLVFGIGLGAWGMHTWQVTDLQKALALEQVKPAKVVETVKTLTDTKLQYVKGETVYLPAPTASSPGATTAAKLDGKFDIGKPNFIYSLNGKPGQFTKADDEKYIFDKNMIELAQTSTITINATIPTIDLTRHNVLTGGGMFSYGKISPAIGYTGSVGKVGAYQLVGSQNGGYVGVGIKF